MLCSPAASLFRFVAWDAGYDVWVHVLAQQRYLDDAQVIVGMAGWSAANGEPWFCMASPQWYRGSLSRLVVVRMDALESGGVSSKCDELCCHCS